MQTTPVPACLALFFSLLIGFPSLAGTPDTPHEFGFEERVRSENWDDLGDFSNRAADTQRQWRFRTKLWCSLALTDTIDALILVNNETKKVTTPETDFLWDEVIFENLYLDFRFGGGWTLRAGRQNFSRGEGFVFMDGGPMDGSRTGYVNGLVLARAKGLSKLEFLALSDPHRDLYLPRFNDRVRPLIEWDEQGLGFYFTHQVPQKTAWETYYFFKTETRDSRPRSSPVYQSDRRFHTVGGRLVQPMTPGWSLTAEAALQWGKQEADRRINAYGGYAALLKTLDRPWKPTLALGYTELSGDDPSTRRNEGWDPLFSRWPKWSELYIYTLARELGVAYWTNLALWQAEIRVTPATWAEGRITWYDLKAQYPFPGKPALYSDGRHRGHLFQARLDLTFGKNWKGHAVYESFNPGDFYTGVDPAYFFRVEASYQFKKKF